MIANATGCSSIYGGNLPVTPWTKNAEGRGPAWSNSLFEDNAEFGLGFRLAADKHLELATLRLKSLGAELGDAFVAEILSAPQIQESEIRAQRIRVVALKTKLAQSGATQRDSPRPALGRRPFGPAQHLDRRRRWLGLRHRLRWARSRARDRPQREHPGARYRGLFQHRRPSVEGNAARSDCQIRAGGKRVSRKDLALQAIAYGNVYVAQLRWAPTRSRRCRHFAKRRPIADLR
jgi:pyruvate-ferredoxin/flavodoxin oxidoreductase